MADEVLDETYNPTFLPELMTAIQVARCDGEIKGHETGRRCGAQVVVREGGRYFCQRHKTQRVIPEDRQCVMDTCQPMACHNYATAWFRDSHLCRFHHRQLVKFLIEMGGDLTPAEIRSAS